MTFSSRTTWTNWTFGIWWGVIGRKRHFGIDIGPFEGIWTKEPS